MSELDAGRRLNPADDDVLARLVSTARYALVGRLANSVTHDINNVIGAGVAYAELVSHDKGISADSRRMLGEVINSLMRGSAMMTGLTVLARPEQLQANAVDLVGLARNTVQMNAFFLKRERTEWEECLPETQVSVLGDAPAIQVALQHLLVNAREALAGLPAEERRLRVTVTDSGDSAELAVWNAGVPLDAARFEECVAPFFTTKAPPHVGLGLHAVRMIAILHDGELAYGPESGFVLRLARHPAFAQQLRAKVTG